MASCASRSTRAGSSGETGAIGNSSFMPTLKFVCWWSWPDQLDSLERLTRHRFVRVVPTHHPISPALDAEEMRTASSSWSHPLVKTQTA